ncbi:GNAT family N-acetyltransferase [Pseudoalteromonas byunsanensis]|uniref:GNAT family N-acetyltransferase n=2 Tax=Pseudoalteromonas byunsanensis TaxID=327939 RepID=A0A1S1NE50_9GAMM|nr:GNAT family N-acetyltransferase [Pseudoalteromonas byunsanensis]
MYSHKFIDAIAHVSEQQWQLLAGTNLFCSYAWLHALEQSQCVHTSTGWQPQHLLIYKNEELVAILPGYIKSHSYGEYVFDWSWADAYQRYGLNYYPKWLCGVPFTPVAGKRILCRSFDADLNQYIYQTLIDSCRVYGWSGAHINFLTEQSASHKLFLHRLDVQFHWINNEYKDFSHYLSCLTSRRRKSIRKERQQAHNHGLSIQWLSAAQIDDEILTDFYHCYQATYIKRSGHQGYLNLAFFKLLLEHLPHTVRLCAAFKRHKLVAASLYLVDENTLYGRYWGALSEFQTLHFELCYYQGIEFAISHSLLRFDAGAQGEHKLIRGFAPFHTHSLHYLASPIFRDAVGDFVQREILHVQEYAQRCTALLPFKQE